MATRFLEEALGFTRPPSSSYLQFLVLGSVCTAILIFSDLVDATNKKGLAVQKENWTVVASSGVRLRSIGDGCGYTMAVGTGVCGLLVAFWFLVMGGLE